MYYLTLATSWNSEFISKQYNFKKEQRKREREEGLEREGGREEEKEVRKENRKGRREAVTWVDMQAANQQAS